MLLDHLDGILNYCRTKVRFGVVEAISANIKTFLFPFRFQDETNCVMLGAW